MIARVIAGSLGNGEERNGSCSVLLVEDNRINQRVAVLMLGRFGISPAVAENGQKAIELAQQRHFDLILMDLHMPGMDGIETTRNIRQRLGAKCPPVVALTADAVSATDADAHMRGLDGYLMKPINSELLRQCINAHTPFKL